MDQDALNSYWEPGYRTLYDAYFRELSAAALVRRWQWIDAVIRFLVALTASGSVIAGWALWSSLQGKMVWGMIAGVASLASIAHGIVAVPGRMKDQEELRRGFSELRVDLETFLQELVIDLPNDEAKTRYNKLRERLAHWIARTPDDVGLTGGLGQTVERHLNDILRAGGYINGKTSSS